MDHFFDKGISTSLVIIIVSLIVLLAGGIFYFFSSQEKPSEPEIIHRIDEKTFDEGYIKIETDVEVRTDCGDMECFEEKFAQCKPATITIKLTEMIIYYYEIIGPNNALCEVKSKFIANLNPEWVGKEMVCRYDNSQDFETAVQDMSHCEGPLYNLMMGR